MSDKGDDVLWLFLAESEQNVLSLDRLFVKAESAGAMSDGEIAEVFRLVHTLKGASAMMQYQYLEQYSHSLEDVFSVLRKGKGITLNRENHKLLDAGFQFSDYFLQQLERIKTGKELQASPELALQLATLGTPDVGEAANSGEAPHASPHTLPVLQGGARLRMRLSQCPMPHIRCNVAMKAAKKLCISLATNPNEPQLHPELADALLAGGIEISLLPAQGVTIQNIIDALSAQPFVARVDVLEDDEPSDVGGAKADGVVHIPQSRVNALLAVLEELVTSQSMLAEALDSAGQTDSVTEHLLSQLRRDVEEARELASEMGMVEIGTVFNQMRRLVRSMAQEYGRRIDVITSGDEVPVDAGVIDIVSEALIHLVRNAVDHGIEPPEKRLVAGKPDAGAVSLSAKKDNGHIIITISDDGCGIDRTAVMEKAAAMGFSQKSGDDCSDVELMNILASPGFSTNTTVTKYSGRGVGLDAAVKRIRNMRGTIALSSQVRLGTTFTLRIPTTLSLRQALNAVIDGCPAALPVSAVSAVAYASQVIEHDGLCAFGGKEYKRLKTGGNISDEPGDVYIFMTPEYGSCCIRAASVGVPGEALVKSLPACAAELLGDKNIFAGCCIESDGQILCLLDIYKLAAMNKIGTEE